MSHLNVIAFDDAGEAEKVRRSLRAQQKEGLVSVEDAAIVSRDAEGKLNVKNEVSRATMVGTGIAVSYTHLDVYKRQIYCARVARGA